MSSSALHMHQKFFWDHQQQLVDCHCIVPLVVEIHERSCCGIQLRMHASMKSDVLARQRLRHLEAHSSQIYQINLVLLYESFHAYTIPYHTIPSHTIPYHTIAVIRISRFTNFQIALHPI